MYKQAYIFTKETDLLPWLYSKRTEREVPESTHIHYALPREVQLILLVRYENEHTFNGNVSHCICRIKCPVNPLPIKGEFEASNVSDMIRLLQSLGWELKYKHNLGLFK